MARNIQLVTEGWSKEVTIILHEHATLTGEARAHINARKKRYVRFLESSFAEAVRRGQIRPVNPKVAAFAFLGRCSGSTSGSGRTGPSSAPRDAGSRRWSTCSSAASSSDGCQRSPTEGGVRAPKS